MSWSNDSGFMVRDVSVVFGATDFLRLGDEGAELGVVGLDDSLDNGGLPLHSRPLIFF